MQRLATLALAALLLGAAPEKSEGRFPSPKKLEDLADKPLPEEGFERPMEIVDEWAFAGPFPNVVAAVPYRAPSDWGALLEVAAQRRAGLVVGTEPMHCAAREWGRFFLEHEAPPGPDLLRYLSARCTTVSPSVRYFHFTGGIPEAASDAEVFESWRGAVDAMMADHFVGGPLTAGIWFGRKEGRAVVTVSFGERLLRVDPIPTVFEEGDGTFVVRGEVLIPAEGISGAVNRGEFDSMDCDTRPDVALPRFELECKVDRVDARSWLTVFATPPGRLLARNALNAVLWPSGKPSDDWRRQRYGEPILVDEDTDIEAALLERINAVRKRAGRQPLVLEEAQSEAARDLAPMYFASVFGKEPPQSGDLVVLGILAGWGVEGVVQDADFVSAWSTGAKDLDRLIATALQYPSGRQTLLGPAFERLAIGTIVHKEGAFLASIFSAYTLFDETRHDEAAGAVLEKLDGMRAASGKRPVRHLVDVASLARLSAQRVQAGEKPKDVLGDLLQQASTVLRRPVNGWVLYATHPERVEFPPGMLESNTIEIAIGVSHTQPEGDPWGQYVILVVGAESKGRGA